MSLTLARWKSGPPICEVANLPAFLSKKALNKFLGSLCTPAIISWQCGVCMRWHCWPKPKAPAGSSSGTERPYRIPNRVVKLINETRYDQSNE